MGDENDTPRREMAKWDPEFTAQIAKYAGELVKRYHRAEVRGLENFPAVGAALAVSNHSGGMLTPDVLVLAPEFYKRFGYDRPMYTLAHYGVVMGPLGDVLGKAGVIEASRDSAALALHDGAVVLVFPGGDYDSYRPTWENKIDFNGRTGYIRTAIEAGVPIVPVVSIGAQESQLFLTRGNWLAKRLGLTKARWTSCRSASGFPSEYRYSSRPTSRCRARSSPKSSSRSTSVRGSVLTPTSPQWTPMCVASCKARWIASPGNADCRSWAELARQGQFRISEWTGKPCCRT